MAAAAWAAAAAAAPSSSSRSSSSRSNPRPPSSVRGNNTNNNNSSSTCSLWRPDCSSSSYLPSTAFSLPPTSAPMGWKFDLSLLLLLLLLLQFRSTIREWEGGGRMDGLLPICVSKLCGREKVGHGGHTTHSSSSSSSGRDDGQASCSRQMARNKRRKELGVCSSSNWSVFSLLLLAPLSLRPLFCRQHLLIFAPPHSQEGSYMYYYYYAVPLHYRASLLKKTAHSPNNITIHNLGGIILEVSSKY